MCWSIVFGAKKDRHRCAYVGRIEDGVKTARQAFTSVNGKKQIKALRALIKKTPQ